MNRRTFTATSTTLAVTTGLVRSASAQTASPFKLNYAPGFRHFKNSAGTNPLDQIKFMHDNGFRAIQNRTREALSDHALQFTATITDVRMKSAGVYQVSFKELNDGRLNKNKHAHLRIQPARSINLKMNAKTARNIHPGQKITVRAKAKLSTSTLNILKLRI
ncbi:MAG: hypothetical protein V3V05_01185 [Pontiella sp.]